MQHVDEIMNDFGFRLVLPRANERGNGRYGLSELGHSCIPELEIDHHFTRLRSGRDIEPLQYLTEGNSVTDQRPHFVF